MAQRQQVVNETVSNAVTNSSNTGATGGTEPFTIASMLQGDLMMYVIFGALAIALTIIGGIIAYYVKERKETEEEFEKESLDEIILPEIRKAFNEAKVNKSTYRRDLRNLGEVYKDVRFTEKGDLIEHLNELDKDSEFDLKTSFDDSERETVEGLYDQGVISHKEVNDIVEESKVPHRLLWIRPSSFTGKLKWVVTDGLLGKETNSEYKLIPEHLLVDNPANNSITVDRNVQLRPFGGVDIPLYMESFGVLHSVVMRKMFESSLEDQANYSEKINFFDSKFSQQIQKLQAEADIEKSKYNDGVAGDVNNS